MVSIKLIESDRQIAAKINNALAKSFSKSMTKAIPEISSKVKSVVSGALFASDEIQSLSGGLLAADFGLTFDPSSSLVSAIVSTININVKNTTATSAGIKGGFTLTMQPSDFNNLFSLPISQQPIDGGSLPWLEWLLTLGDTIIIGSFGVEYGPHGRTGKAHMTKRARPFKVNSSFSGTIDNNFITRAVATVSQDIKNIIIGAVK
jgi:hypothetical protein